MRVGKGQVGGTPGYMAPEVLRGEGADVRSDVYSFGVVLHQMVTGNPSVRLVNRYELAPLARVDSVLWPLIERCLLAQARSRYPSFRMRTNTTTETAMSSIALCTPLAKAKPSAVSAKRQHKP